MSTIAIPTYLRCESLVPPQLQRPTVSSRSRYTGASDIIDLMSGEWWEMTVGVAPGLFADGAKVEALINQLVGGVNFLSCHHLGRPAPTGTARGTPTLSAAMAKGANTAAITGATAGGAYEIGDMLGIGGYLFQVASQVTLNGSGAGTVTFVNRSRATLASGSAVVWDKPAISWQLKNMPMPQLARGIAGAVQLELREWVR